MSSFGASVIRPLSAIETPTASPFSTSARLSICQNNGPPANETGTYEARETIKTMIATTTRGVFNFQLQSTKKRAQESLNLRLSRAFFFRNLTAKLQRCPNSLPGNINRDYSLPRNYEFRRGQFNLELRR